MDDLAQFLRARLNEDRQNALDATFEQSHPQGNHWAWGEVGNVPEPVVRDGYLWGNGGLSSTVSLITVEKYPIDGLAFSAPVLYGAHRVYEGVARHIVRHDPARVLREIDAKLRIIDEIVPAMDGMDDQINSDRGVLPMDPSDYESVALLRLLALPYADHVDYKEGWRP